MNVTFTFSICSPCESKTKKKCPAMHVFTHQLEVLSPFFAVEDKRRPLKRFTPPRKATGSDSETESGSDYSDSDSEYSDSSYT